MILALLGDNPMQSEFACHIGLGSKFFCRACWVKGTDATGNADEESGNNQDDVVSDNGSATGSEVVADDGGSDSGSTSGKKTTTWWKKVVESMSSMVNRVKSFIKVCRIYFSPT
jgi:hypothetical protein